MKYSLTILVTFLSLVAVPTVNAQSLEDVARQAKIEAKRKVQQQAARYDAIVESRDLDKYNAFLKDYPTGKRSDEIRRRANEIKAWRSAQNANTVAGYEKYLAGSKYHWYDAQARSAIASIRKAEERTAWNTVVAVGTVEAYRKYLEVNPNTGYRDEAEAAIRRIEAEKEWGSVCNSHSPEAFEAFVAKYPDTEHAAEARNRCHELRGRQYYDYNELNKAYVEFAQVAREKVHYENLTAYDKTMEYYAYATLGQYSSESELLAFLNRYPQSEYRPAVSNLYAMKLAKKLTKSSGEYDFNRVRSFATDAATRTTVDNYINNIKKQQEEDRKWYKRYERRENGGWVNMGWTFLSGCYNIIDGDGPHSADMGIMFRIGNYKDRVQFAIGVQPGALFGEEFENRSYWNYEYDYNTGDYSYHYVQYEYSTSVTKFHMPALAQLKVNLFPMSENSRFFVHGMFKYNVIREERCEPEMQWAAGFGFGWKHIDWSFFYSAPIENDTYIHDIGQVGMSLTWYWKL